MSAKTSAVETSTFNLKAVQQALNEQDCDGWLFYFFRDNDALAKSILCLPDVHSTRRWFYFVPKNGEPTKLVHRIEMEALNSLPGKRTVYLGWLELKERLSELLSSGGKVAMQYSPEAAVPYVSRVDAGTVELVRSCGVEVITSADLVQLFEARWSPAQLETHLHAVDILRRIVFEGFAEIRRLLEAGQPVNEYQIQQFIYNAYDRYGLKSDSPPIVAVNGHAGSPHYQPSSTEYDEIKRGDFVLFDIWAKQKEPADAVYADITWTGFVGETVPQKYEDIFQIVAGSRDAAVDFIKTAVKEKRQIKGAEVDDVTRNYIATRGYGDAFVHRTGHSIGAEYVHGNGANIDNLETKDTRTLVARTAFSIEPGIYLADFGVRSEIDVYLAESEVVIGGLPIQTRVVPIMTDWKD